MDLVIGQLEVKIKRVRIRSKLCCLITLGICNRYFSNYIVRYHCC